jgi:hypothetical protein
MASTRTARFAAILALAGCWSSVGIASADPPAPPPEPKTVIDHDGTYAVGTDIVPGIYSSAGPIIDGTCYWKRTGGPDGDDIVDNAMTKKPQVVVIDPGDTAFKTSGCQPWQLTPGANVPGGLPPMLGGAMMQGYLGDLNAKAGQAGDGQLPQP